MIIYTSSNIVRLESHESVDSEVLFQISNEEYATIKFELNSWIPFDAGDYVTLFGNRYTLMDKPAPIAVNGSNRYSYTLKFESPRAFLDDVNFELFDDTSLLVIDVYDAKTIYCKGSVVQDTMSQVWLYKSDTPALGIALTDTTSWDSVPQWIVGSYVAGNYVYLSNVVYLCLVNNSLTPSEGTNWTVVNTAPAFDFTTVLSPHDYADLICKNMNRARPNQHWVVGNCISANPLMQAFSNVTCLGALTSICNLFQSQSNVATEHWIDMVTILIGGVSTECFRLNINSLAVTTTPTINLSQGKNNGLVSITKQDTNNSKRITRLVALGSTSNLYGTYRNGSNRLMLPNRYYLDAANIDPNSPLEGVMTWDNIMPEISHATEDYNPLTAYPVGYQVLDTNGYSFDCILASTGHDTTNTTYWKLSEGTVTTVVTENVTNIFIDANLSFNPLDPQRIMTDGTVPKVSFITGNMAGYQFPITNSDPATGGGWQLTIAQIQDSVGSYLPTTSYGFNQYDQYVFVDLYMPQSYTDKAEQRLLAQAELYLAQYSIDQSSYDCPIDSVWATNNAVGFSIGQLVHLTNVNLGLDDDYRIITLTRNITLPYVQKITLSQLPYIPSTYQQLKNDTTQNSTTLQQSGVSAPMFKSKTFRGAQEALDIAFDPDGSFYTKTIEPLTVMTASLLVGTRTQQFAMTGLAFSAVTNTPNYIAWTSGTITDTVMETSPRTWTVVSGNFTATDGDAAVYYCYLKCPIDSAFTSGVILFTQTQYKTKGTDYYYFLVGTLGAVVDNMRQFYTSYGFTFINGNTIVTGKIQSTSGSTYIDLDNDKIGGTINFVDGLISGMIGISDDAGVINSGLQGDNAINLAAWFGGTEAEALAGTAATIFNKDGTGQLAGGAIKWELISSLLKLIINTDNFSIDVDGNVVVSGLFKTGNSGQRIVIDPVTQSIKIIDANGNVVVSMDNYDNDAGQSYGRISVNWFVDNVLYYKTFIGASTVEVQQMDSLGVNPILTTQINPNGIYCQDGSLNTIFQAMKIGSQTIIKTDFLPTSVGAVSIGEWYRDGDTIKVRVS